MTSPVVVSAVGSLFEARVVMARPGADGFVTQWRGGGDDTDPLSGPVQVLVLFDPAQEAREVLLADQVGAVLAESGPTVDEGSGPVGPRRP